ncbi:hypothetical protein KY317_02625 [Candidatus Woesearchaeota archaeon]|nr:hypothetical protein [Candidatus Woesearchaeota archaeon]
MVKFIIGIVIAIALLVPTALWAGQLFRLSDDARDSFNELIQKINSISGKPAGTIEPIAFHMDENTGVYGWANGFDSVNVYTRHSFLGGERLSKVVNRFGECKGNKKTCVCLCREFSDTLFSDKGVGYVQCVRSECHVLENINFLKDVEAEGVFIKSRNPNVLHRVEGGFAIERTGFGKAYTVMEPKLRTEGLYVEKGKENIVALCILSPCIK